MASLCVGLFACVLARSIDLSFDCLSGQSLQHEQNLSQIYGIQVQKLNISAAWEYIHFIPRPLPNPLPNASQPSGNIYHYHGLLKTQGVSLNNTQTETQPWPKGDV